LKQPDLLHKAAHGVVGAGIAYSRGDVQGLLASGISLVKELTTTQDEREIYRRSKASSADVIQLSGCKDYQTSADTMEGVCIFVN
jgi:metacaspase-1